MNIDLLSLDFLVMNIMFWLEGVSLSIYISEKIIHVRQWKEKQMVGKKKNIVLKFQKKKRIMFLVMLAYGPSINITLFAH